MRPNILHLFTDMQRFDTIHALGNPVIRTPNLDRLCSEGVAFTQAFSPSPVCISARCSMITGQYPMHTGCYENTLMPVDGRTTFMGELHDHGYDTHGIGKCHFTPDRFALRGFDAREVQEEGAESIENLDRHHYLQYLRDRSYTHISEPHGIRGEMYYIPQPSQLPQEDHPTTWVGDRTIEFLGQEHVQPWYLFSSFIHPHPPFTPPVPWHKLYRSAQMPDPDTPEDSEELLTFVNRIQNRYKYGDQGANRYLIRSMKAYYYACISYVDYQIGRILQTLESSGQLDSTLILFSSDHGELLGDYHSFGKRSMHDASSRIPMILQYPGRFEGGRTCDTPVSLVDIAPTFLAAAGCDERSVSTHPLDGKDMYKILTGEETRETVFSQLSYECVMAERGINPAQRHVLQAPDAHAHLSTYMAVTREWKYIYSAADDKEFLFDRRKDPKEHRNLAEVELCQDVKHTMKRRLTAHLTEGGETYGLTGTGEWKSFPKLEINSDPYAGLLIQDDYTPWADMSLPKEYGD